MIFPCLKCHNAQPLQDAQMCNFERIILRIKWWILLDVRMQKKGFDISVGHLFFWCQTELMNINLTSVRSDCLMLHTTGQRAAQQWSSCQQVGLKHGLWSLSYYFANPPLFRRYSNLSCRSRASSAPDRISFRSLDIDSSIRRSWFALSLRWKVVASSPEGCFWAPESRERQPGSCSGPSPRPGAYAADLRDESCGIPPPRRLPLPVTHRCWGKPRLRMMWLIFAAACGEVC